jgi:hypothetical protein
MAKMFYTLEEAKGALGKSEDEIKQFAREGRLREFRDGPRLMFKADQVEQLRSELGAGGDTVDLGVSDSGGMIGLVDTTGASGTSITLAESDTGMGTGAGMSLSEDTSGGHDIGLSGSLGGVPSPTRGGTGGGTGIPLAAGTTSGGTAAGVSASGLSGSMAGRSRGGVNVFGTEDVGFADPSAQTAISNAAARDASVNLETVGSGSGLLDLTRESDDTSLGAVLDEIGPSGATRAAPAMGTDMGAAAMHDLHEPAVDRRPVAAPVMVQALDSTAPAFGAASLAGFAAMLFGAFVLISALVGAIPRETVEWLTGLGLFIIAAMGIGAALLLFALGWVVGKSVRA